VNALEPFSRCCRLPAGQGQKNAPEADLGRLLGMGGNAPCLMISENLFDLEA